MMGPKSQTGAESPRGSATHGRSGQTDCLDRRTLRWAGVPPVRCLLTLAALGAFPAPKRAASPQQHSRRLLPELFPALLPHGAACPGGKCAARPRCQAPDDDRHTQPASARGRGNPRRSGRSRAEEGPPGTDSTRAKHATAPTDSSEPPPPAPTAPDARTKRELAACDCHGAPRAAARQPARAW